MRLSRTTISLLTAAGILSGCADPEISTNESDVVDIDHSKVKRQAIGNCWVYATVGWAESLHLTHSGEELNLSESWISYWHWYEQIVGDANISTVIVRGSDELATGGWWTVGVELMRRYGVVDEGTFIEEEADDIRSASQAAAEDAIREALESGVLKDPAARKDRALVRQVLDEAWGLTPEVRAQLDATFGSDVSKNLVDSLSGDIADAGDWEGFYTADDIDAGVDSNDESHVLTLADAIGEPTSRDVHNRKGKYAWDRQWVPWYDSDKRNQQILVQKALHRRLPVVMSWWVDFNAEEDDGTYRKKAATPGNQGGHMVNIEDYEIDNVPGYGTLKAGELADADALQAALDPDAKIKFFRIKNSWGTGFPPPAGLEEFAGYHDLYTEYLYDNEHQQCIGTGSNKCDKTKDVSGLWSFVLPPKTYAVKSENAPAPTTGAEPHLQEVSYDAPGSDSANEWYTIANPGTSPLSLSGYTIADNSKSCALDGEIPAGATFVIARSASGYNALTGNDADIECNNIALGNNGDVLEIIGPNGNVVDYVAWEGHLADWDLRAATGETLGRENVGPSPSADDWAVWMP